MADVDPAVGDGTTGAPEGATTLSAEELQAELDTANGNNEKLLRVKAKLDKDLTKYRVEKKELNERLVSLEADSLDEDEVAEFKAFREQSVKDPKKAEAGKLANELKKVQKQLNENKIEMATANKATAKATGLYNEMMLANNLQAIIGDKSSDTQIATMVAKNSGLFALNDMGQLIVVDSEGDENPEHTAEQTIDMLLEKHPALKKGIVAPGSGADTKTTGVATGDWKTVLRRGGINALMQNAKLYDANRDEINDALNNGELEKIMGEKAFAKLKPGVPLDIALS